MLTLATEEFQHISTHIDDPVDIIYLSSTSVVAADALRSTWVWKKHLDIRGIDTVSLHLPPDDPDITYTPKHWVVLARLACSLFIVRSPLARTPSAIQDTLMARSLALKNALGPSYLRKLASVTASIDSGYCLLCGDTTLLRLLSATSDRPGTLVNEWVLTMARLLYHEMIAHESVRSVSLRTIQEQTKDFGAFGKAFRLSEKSKPRSIICGTIITMHVLYAIAAMPPNTPNRITTSRRVPAAFSNHVYNPFLSPNWVSGQPLHFVGYYTYYIRQRLGQAPRLPDPPTSMFLCRDQVPGRIGGQGSDGAGKFTIEGEVYDNEIISFTKSYELWSWTWRGVVLPWGIAGVWGRGRGWKGMFFIWLQDAKILD
ncbi:hypothetical protein FRB95_010753 [Tulasnella sp. JGI-2019a]|nr:hypothetical protein FRB95_010753 [Tulasnella sp. JGI-2019a]